MTHPMDPIERFESVCLALSDPSFYPHPVSQIERRDTHISAVFLTGKWVYKLKKPVDFGFLNFCKPADRLKFCQQEVSLNRRFSRDIYQGVVKIHQTEDGRFTLEEKGTVAEYAVKMRQLPDASSFKALLNAGKIKAKQLTALGEMLAEFYETSRRTAEIDRFGGLDILSFNIEENFRQLEPFRDTILEPEKWDFICRASRSFLEMHRALFERRVEGGHIRDGHGDLRAEHIYFYKGIQIIDCIEFNDRFRYGDTALDLAFLHMDLEHLGHADASRRLLAAYAAKADDPELYVLLDFYAAYRAVVRLKVSCLQLQNLDVDKRSFLQMEAKKYLNQAWRYALQFSRPTLWVFCGLPATGKSMLAEQLARILSIPILQSDRLRKEGLESRESTVVPFGQGLYRREARHQVYRRMFDLARRQLEGGCSVILDATFARREWRREAQQVALSQDANLIFVECICDPQIIRSRLEEREKTAGVSDARLQHLPDMIKSFEPLTEFAADVHLPLETQQPFRHAFNHLLAESYHRQSLQVKQSRNL